MKKINRKVRDAVIIAISVIAVVLMADTGVVIDYKLNGKDAVRVVGRAVAGRQEYNIVLIDWKMPEMNGYEATRLLARKSKDDTHYRNDG